MIDKALLEKARQAARNADAANQNTGHDPLSGEWHDPIEAATHTYLQGLWRPIEEAPRDGTMFLAFYDDKHGPPVGPAQWIDVDAKNQRLQSWCQLTRSEHATHYIPLSALPVPEEKE